jgi:hypothetical protein
MLELKVEDEVQTETWTTRTAVEAPYIISEHIFELDSATEFTIAPPTGTSDKNAENRIAIKRITWTTNN